MEPALPCNKQFTLKWWRWIETQRARTPTGKGHCVAVIVIFIVLVLAVFFFVDIPDFLNETLPALRRARAGADPLTPEHRRQLIRWALYFTVSAAVFWTLFAEGIRLGGVSRPFAVLSSVGILAPLIWLYVHSRGEVLRRQFPPTPRPSVTAGKYWCENPSCDLYRISVDTPTCQDCGQATLSRR